MPKVSQGLVSFSSCPSRQSMIVCMAGAAWGWIIPIATKSIEEKEEEAAKLRKVT